MKMQKRSKSRKVMGQRLNLFAWSGQEDKYLPVSLSKILVDNLSSHEGFLELSFSSGQVEGLLDNRSP